MKYYIGNIPYGNDLTHSGIKGQRWGVRRFQNEDRTWTAAGKERYGDDKASRINQKAELVRAKRGLRSERASRRLERTQQRTAQSLASSNLDAARSSRRIGRLQNRTQYHKAEVDYKNRKTYDKIARMNNNVAIKNAKISNKALLANSKASLNRAKAANLNAKVALSEARSKRAKQVAKNVLITAGAIGVTAIIGTAAYKNRDLIKSGIKNISDIGVSKIINTGVKTAKNIGNNK